MEKNPPLQRSDNSRYTLRSSADKPPAVLGLRHIRFLPAPLRSLIGKNANVT
jgi:hypothetical protein